MNASLVVIAGPRAGEVISLTPGELSIGRDAANELSLPDLSLSRRHCVVRVAAEAVAISDLDSLNGTFVGDVPVKERSLEDGDVIKIGRSQLLFLDREHGAAPSGIDLEDAVLRRTTVALRQNGVLLKTSTLLGEANGDRTLVGESAAMQAVYALISRVAATDSTVILRGETGTGKELAARAIHRASARARQPFVVINCAALTETLLESELFGHEKGAFTGAIAQKKGKLELAHGGTVFLDEIAEISPVLQSKLLRALQEREFDRVGGTRSIRVDLRFIAATNQNLEAAVQEGRFRHDLYYRLNVISLTMPPLRERREDIPLLARYFAARYGGRCNRATTGISPEATSYLLNYEWPGNVRELENAIERAIVLATADCICPEDLPESILEVASPPVNIPAMYHDAVKQAKRRIIQDALEQAGGHYVEAAALLGLNPTYLHRLIRNMNLQSAARKPLSAGES